jgi:hypothetical protein
VKPGTGEQLVLLGAHGFIGRLHAEIYRSLGIEVIECDSADPLTQVELDAIAWSELSSPA